MPGTPESLLNRKEFWFHYQNVEGGSLSEEFIREFAGADADGIGSSATISIGCPAGYSLELGISLGYFSNDLSLKKPRGSKCMPMGWWDEARWHPYCLRWVELLRFFSFWKRNPKKCKTGPNAAFLLLAPFVGICADELNYIKSYRAEIAGVYESMPFLRKTDRARLTSRTLIPPTEADYRWTRDKSLGFVFGGEYPCYSLRNAAHIGGGEGKFPFADWKKILSELPRASR